MENINYFNIMSNRKIKYAPIIIPTLCRYKHLVRLIESLKVNTWAKYTDIYIGLDYPPSSKYEKGYRLILKYLDNDFPEFASFNVIKHKVNLGSFANSCFLRNIVLQKYDRFIRIDDDIELSPNFIEYMDKCLMEYEYDPNIIAVSGYSYPIRWKVSEGANIFMEDFICPMWGTGFWKDKFLKICDEIQDGCLRNSIDTVLKKGLYKRMLNASKIEYLDLCTPYLTSINLAKGVNDISMRMYSVIYNKYIIMPVKSKTRNWGFDGTGEYCPKNNKFSFELQDIDTSLEFDVKMDSDCRIDENRELLEKFEDISYIMLLKLYIKIILYRILGKYAFYYRRFKCK